MLKHFDGQRYHLLAWCIMPNHVHVVVQPLAGVELAAILHSWKLWTARAANKLLDRSGEYWLPEYYDHLVRDEEELRHVVGWAFENPEKSGLTDWVWRGKNQRQLQSILNLQLRGSHGLETRDTPHGAHALETRGTDAFTYIRNRLGIENAHTLQLGSPFDYASQATLYLETDLPEPSDTLRFLPAACEKIVEYVNLTSGGAFVLFTSYAMLARRRKTSGSALNCAATRCSSRGKVRRDERSSTVSAPLTMPYSSAPAASGRVSTCRAIACATSSS